MTQNQEYKSFAKVRSIKSWRKKLVQALLASKHPALEGASLSQGIQSLQFHDIINEPDRYANFLAIDNSQEVIKRRV
jgi:hypothetical protein